MPIRIMHVVDTLERGGLENGLVNIIGRMDPVKFEHAVCTIRGLGANLDRLPVERVQLLSLADSGSVSRFHTPALIRAIRKFEPDIVHSRNWGTIEAVLAARLAGVPAVAHSEHGFEAKASAREPWRRVCFRRLAYELADRVLSVSYQLRELQTQRTGFPARKISVIHNGVDRSRYYPDTDDRARMRQELGIKPTDFCLGCVANLLPVKDHMTLFKAVAALPENGVDWRLLIAGEGFERPRLEAFVAGHPGLKDRVTFLGSTSRIPELLRALDVFVLPSIAEGLCNSLLEAMASGLAVVATAVGGNPEVVVDGESGLLFTAQDVAALTTHLSRLRADAQLRANLGQGALDRVRVAFSLESMVQAYERLYIDMRAGVRVPAVSAG